MILQNTRRLQLERAIMAKELPQFYFYWMGEDRYFQGWQATSTGAYYQLKLDLPAGYPDEMPRLYITSPIPLWKCNGRTINSEGVSHDFHSLGSGPGGSTEICHFKSSNWDASKTCVGVFFKGILWCEALNVHLATGMTIAEILEGWRRTQAGMGINDFLARLFRRQI
jgi:hypothetical protein